jgi:hypothetical protein
MGTRKTRLCTTGANAPEGKQDADCSVSNGVFSLLLLWCFATELRATRHTSHVTRHTSHVTRHTSHVTRHTSHVFTQCFYARLRLFDHHAEVGFGLVPCVRNLDKT